MTNTTQLDYLQDRLGSSLNTPPGTENIPHRLPVSAPAATEYIAGSVAAPELDRAARFKVVLVSALVSVTIAFGLFSWLR
jgi:hypothetical protein